MNTNYRQQAIEFFNVLNTVSSNDGKGILDKEELKQARACGLAKGIFNFETEEVSEKAFIDKYIKAAKEASTNEIRKESFEELCNSVKTCYEDLKKYGQLEFGLEGKTQTKSIEVNLETIERVPKEGMYTMFHGYKILYTNNKYTCPDQPQFQSEKNILGLRFQIKQDIQENKIQNLNESLNKTESREEKEKIVKEFVDDLLSWRIDNEIYRINGITGPQSIRVNGLDIFFNIEKDYSITFLYDKIFEQIH